MATERLQIVIDASVKGKRDVEGLNNTIGDMGNRAPGVGSKMAGLASKIGLVAGGLFVVKEAAGAAWEYLGQGAELEAARGRFDNLAESIGVTGDALMNTLRQATSGMVSDAELVTSATDIISLGLAGTEDDVARLATVISTLGLDMQQVIMTFANNSVMRLDALGLSVEDVQTKAKELEQQGFVGDAFDEAVLIALEEKMVLLGDASATTAGHMAILKAEAQNAKDAIKRFFLSIVDDPIERAAKATETYRLQLKQTAREIAEAADSPAEMRREMEKMFGPDIFNNAEEMGLAWVDLGNGASFWIDELERAATKTDDYSESLDNLRRMSQEYTTVAGTSATATQDYVYSLEELAQMGREAMPEAMENMAEAEAAAAEETRLLKEAHDAAKAAAEEHAAMTGDLFAEALSTSAEETKSLAMMLYEEADAAGASAEELAFLALATGEFTEEQVQAALEAAIMKEQIQLLAEQVADGSITVQQATDALGLMQGGMAGSVAEAQTLIGEMENMSVAMEALNGKTVNINFSAPGLSGIVQQMSALQGGAGGVVKTTNTNGNTQVAGALAYGGSVDGGKSYLVGELGPEVFVPDQSGQIVPNNQMGGTTINITINGSGGGRRMGQQVAAEVTNALGRLN